MLYLYNSAINLLLFVNYLICFIPICVNNQFIIKTKAVNYLNESYQTKQLIIHNIKNAFKTQFVEPEFIQIAIGKAKQFTFPGKHILRGC